MPKVGLDLRPAVGYLRRSTDRQEQSLADQEAAINRYAEANGLDILRLYTDDAISGTSADNRPAFQRLMADASNGHRDFRFVLCYDVKRFSRGDNDEAGYYRYLLKKNGVEVLYASEGFNGDDTDDLVRSVKQFLARQESKDLSKVTLRGQLSSIRAGSYLGGVPPLGYDYLYVDSQDRPIQRVRYTNGGAKEITAPDGQTLHRVVPQGERLTSSKEDRIRLVPSSPDRVALVRRIFDEYMRGYGYKAIASRFNAEGVPSPRSGEWDATKYNGRWCVSTIRGVLCNPVYAGDTVWNRRAQGKFHRVSVQGVVERRRQTTRFSEPNPQEDWIITPNTHERLVPRAVFMETQNLRRERHAAANYPVRPRGRGYYSNYLLTGLITCADCGHKFIGLAHKSRACKMDPSLPRPRYYTCSGYVQKGPSVCKRRALLREPLEASVLSRLEARLHAFLADGGEKVLRQYIHEALARNDADPRMFLVDVRREIATLKRDVDRLLTNLTAANRDFVDEKLGAIRRRLQELKGREEELQAQTGKAVDEKVVVEAALAHVGRFRDILAHGSIVEQKDLIRHFIAGITIAPSMAAGVITWYNLHHL